MSDFASNRKRVVVWFRKDLRLNDHPALLAALSDNFEIIPIFIWDPKSVDIWRPGEASRWWLHQSLLHLSHSIKCLGGSMLFFSGNPREILPRVCKDYGANALFFGRCYEPASVQLESTIETLFSSLGICCQSFKSNLLHEPWEVSNQSGKPYRVFTPYWRSARVSVGTPPLAYSPSSLKFTKRSTNSLDSLNILPKDQWHNKFSSNWNVSEYGAKALINRLNTDFINSYQFKRDFPADEGTSRLAPFLAWGIISPRQVCTTVLDPIHNQQEDNKFLAQIGWREFSYHLLHYFPHTCDTPLREKYSNFPWRDNHADLNAWQKGETGYPFVDAGMRQLWETGWMHNRVRMVVASFLVKHLLLPWQDGARWFWNTLVDADLANNTQGWQWVAGCGADAAPYFRIFNPVIQGEKFDSQGDYIRKWVPELKRLPNSAIHSPWTASANVLQAAGIQLGVNYPEPIVNHSEARNRALKALDSIS
ncbi:MAG: deoxyribodipyrimidine photo-lyase [Opitutae bacterium]|nr:deoxyribodipyrimidine photo-lyase [Opitutae bacterium]